MLRRSSLKARWPESLTLPIKSLPKYVRHVNVLLTSIEAIETAVRVFLELREVGRIELETIIIK